MILTYCFFFIGKKCSVVECFWNGAGLTLYLEGIKFHGTENSMLIVKYAKNMKTNVPTVNVSRGAFRNQSSRCNREFLQSH